MRRLRWSALLPIGQFVVAVVLLEFGIHDPGWRGTSSYSSPYLSICQGLNAPALLLRGLWNEAIGKQLNPAWRSVSVFGLYLDDVVLLPAVIVLWYLVGRLLDSRTLPHARTNAGAATLVIVSVGLVSLGVWFLIGSLNEISHYGYGWAIRKALVVAWGVVLIVLPTIAFVRVVRTRPT